MQLVLSLAILAATIFTLIDVITSVAPRNLSKVFWVIIVIIVPVIGIVLWWAVGHNYPERSEPVPFGDPRRYEASRVARSTPMDDDDIDAAVEREIAFHENQARIARLEREVQARRDEVL